MLWLVVDWWLLIVGGWLLIGGGWLLIGGCLLLILLTPHPYQPLREAAQSASTHSPPPHHKLLSTFHHTNGL
ncbi:hypothetical protein CEN40_14570 [Fischerella thermalis CCMEE 5205]|nr:hypothetical protein CEN40_14570 [Fischerella thermalis CCMEE 5205]